MRNILGVMILLLLFLSFIAVVPLNIMIDRRDNVMKKKISIEHTVFSQGQIKAIRQIKTLTSQNSALRIMDTLNPTFVLEYGSMYDMSGNSISSSSPPFKLGAFHDPFLNTHVDTRVNTSITIPERNVTVVVRYSVKYDATSTATPASLEIYAVRHDWDQSPPIDISKTQTISVEAGNIIAGTAYLVIYNEYPGTNGDRLDIKITLSVPTASTMVSAEANITLVAIDDTPPTVSITNRSIFC